MSHIQSYGFGSLVVSMPKSCGKSEQVGQAICFQSHSQGHVKMAYCCVKFNADIAC